MNRVTLYGRVEAPPQMGHTSGGASVANLRLMTRSRMAPDKVTGAPRERQDWHRVTLWGRLAEELAPQLREGTMLLVEGSLRTSSYEKDGQKRYVTDVHADQATIAGGASPAAASVPPAQDEIPF